MRGTSLEQRVRVALASLQAREGGRPVAPARLLRELRDVGEPELASALSRLEEQRLARRVPGGWLSAPAPTSTRATSAHADLARLHPPRLT
ncbi:MAG TPA: hypothetical protein VM582_05935 [Candidatus Thermoplasmatota archaeon]|nr:hypothetical protein [Candidatus Thermoplasmatota archaeon]